MVVQSAKVAENGILYVEFVESRPKPEIRRNWMPKGRLEAMNALQLHEKEKFAYFRILRYEMKWKSKLIKNSGMSRIVSKRKKKKPEVQSLKMFCNEKEKSMKYSRKDTKVSKEFFPRIWYTAERCKHEIVRKSKKFFDKKSSLKIVS